MKKSSHRYISITTHRFLNNLLFLDESLNTKIGQDLDTDCPEYAELLIAAANLRSKYQYNRIQEITEKFDSISDVEQCADAMYAEFSSTFGSKVAELIMLDWHNSDEHTTSTAANLWFLKTIDSIFDIAFSFCSNLSELSCTENVEKLAIAIGHIGSVILPTIIYKPIPAFSKSTDELEFVDCFCVDSYFSALYLCLVLSVREKIKIRRCRVCGNFFVPIAKSNEIYCQHCRKTTYDTKIRQDEILSAYRTIYKTQNARKQRNSHRPFITDKFENWKSEAKIKLQQCQAQEITLEEMRMAISSDSWLTDSV